MRLPVLSKTVCLQFLPPQVRGYFKVQPNRVAFNP